MSSDRSKLPTRPKTHKPADSGVVVGNGARRCRSWLISWSHDKQLAGMLAETPLSRAGSLPQEGLCAYVAAGDMTIERVAEIKSGDTSGVSKIGLTKTRLAASLQPVAKQCDFSLFNGACEHHRNESGGISRSYPQRFCHRPQTRCLKPLCCYHLSVTSSIGGMYP